MTTQKRSKDVMMKASQGEALVLAKNILMSIENGVETQVNITGKWRYIIPVYAKKPPYQATIFIGDRPPTEEERIAARPGVRPKDEE